MEYEKFSEKVSNFWGLTREDKLKLGEENTQWLENKYVSQFYVNKVISGDTNKNWLIYVGQKYFKEPVDLGLSIGCGDGCLERHALKLDICKRFEAFDISEKAIEKAKLLIIQESLSDRVSYGVLDFNVARLKENYYDVIFAAASVHHVMNIEFFFEQVNRALKQEGLFIINEYVGPSQFQWREKQCEFVNKILGVLPVQFKRSLDKDYGRIKETIEKVPKEIMDRNDPSEAIRSEEIIPLFYRFFDVIEKIEWGGTILHPLFHKIVGNFDINNEKDKTILDLIFIFEQVLLKEGVISSDFVLLIGRKKTSETRFDQYKIIKKEKPAVGKLPVNQNEVKENKQVKEILGGKDAKIIQLEKALEEIQDTLKDIQTSVGWQILSGYRRIKDKLFPTMTLRRKAYDFVLNIVKDHKKQYFG